MSDQELKEKTRKTAGLYFQDVSGEKPYDLWRAFDKDLARDLSLFITGKCMPGRKSPTAPVN